ncbi:protein-tyrosine phosphatase-like protein [Spinellus fusiger]|nr:protein-tyrosine phosphatase-like protein [Spinellus fusiger]
MLWQHNSRIIVMLTKVEEMGQIKCHQYWPLLPGESTKVGKFKVTLESECMHTVAPLLTSALEGEYYTVRELTLQLGEEIRRVKQFHYTEWSDCHVPENPAGVLGLIKAVHQTQSGLEMSANDVGPMVVHCSAGCGRTGVFCTLDTVIQCLGACEQKEDLIFSVISKFREQRVHMVQTFRQFVFCYEAIVWWLICS